MPEPYPFGPSCSLTLESGFWRCTVHDKASGICASEVREPIATGDSKLCSSAMEKVRLTWRRSRRSPAYW